MLSQGEAAHMSSVANMSPIAPPRLSLLLMAGRSKSSCKVFCFPVSVQTLVRSRSGPTFFPATSIQTGTDTLLNGRKNVLFQASCVVMYTSSGSTAKWTNARFLN